MKRRHHRGLSTVGGAGTGLELGPPLVSDSEDDDLPWRFARGDAASPRVVPESDPEEPDVCPDVRPPRKRHHAPGPGHHPDVAAPCPDPDFRGPKKRRFGPQTTLDPDVRKKPALPNVQPQNHSLNPSKVANPDVKRLEGTNPTLAVESDTDGEAPPETAFFHSKCHQAALEVSSEPDVLERDTNPDVGAAKNGCQMLVVDSDTDVEEAEALPDVVCPERHRTAPNVPKHMGVGMETTNPDVGGAKNGCWAPVDSDTDVEMENAMSAVEGPQNGHRMVVVDSDTDVEEESTRPDVGCPQTPRTTQKEPKPENTEMETHDADVEGSQKGQQMLVVDSDTDVEENGANPDVEYTQTHQTTPNIPKPRLDEMETQKADVEGSQRGHRVLVVGGDTDVQEDTSHLDVGGPQNHRTAPRDPGVKAETPDVEERRPLLVESDTDVEEDTSDPDVGTPKAHPATQNVPKPLQVEAETPNPRAEGPQNDRWTLVVDSDTDVEENEVNPHVGRPKIHRITRQDPDVGVKNANPGVEEPQNARCTLETDSDTDVEGDTRSHKTPQNTRQDPTVVMETPNPDVGSLSRGSVSSSGDSDTDVEDLNPLPDVGGPKARGTTPEVVDTVAKMATAPDVDPQGLLGTNGNPDVKVTRPAPDVGAPKAQSPVLNVDSDTDIEEDGGVPDVGTVQGCQGAPGGPDVAAAPPNPDVSSPASPGDGSDTDMEEVAPTPDVRSLRSRIWSQNQPRPDVGGPTMGSDTNAGERDPNRWKSSPKRQSLSPESRDDASVEGTAPNRPDSAPNADVEAPNPDVEARQHDGESPGRGTDPAVPPDVSAPKSPPLAQNLGGTGDAEGGPGSSGDVGAAGTGSDTDAEEVPDLFLEPTQNFLPPAAEGSTLGWDPEEPTQPFFPREEEEEEEEQPPPAPPQNPPATCLPPEVTVTPAQEVTGTGAAPGGEVREGPRRSQRLRGGGATGGGASGRGGASKGRGGAPLPGPAPLRRSPRLQARPPPPEPPVMRGRGQVEPRPPPKARPSRAGPAPSKKIGQEEEEPPEVAGPRLRPRGGPGSAPLKVLFTGVVASPGMEVALKTLGGSMATSVFDCTHLVTDRVRRTVKFLCAVARGIPIVTPEWLHKSAHSGRILVPGPFLVRDSQQERHFGFSLAQALRRARRHPLLQGYEVHVTPSVRPEPEHMRDIVTCSGGTFLPTMPDTYGPRRLVISCPADAGCWAPALGARLPLASAELLLTGLLRQQLQLQPFLLPPPAAPPKSPRQPPQPPDPTKGFPNLSGGPSSPPQGPPGTPGHSWGPPGGVSTRTEPTTPPGTPPGPPQHPAAPSGPPHPPIKGFFWQ